MSKLLKIFEHDTVFRHWYDKADFEVRKRERPDYYTILKVSTVATESEIKAAYKVREREGRGLYIRIRLQQRALECHPDKVVASGSLTVEEAEAQFKLLGEALEVRGRWSR